MAAEPAAATAEPAAEEKPAKATRKRAAKKAATPAAGAQQADGAAPQQADGAAPQPADAQAAAAPGVLFQAPVAEATPRRRAAKKTKAQAEVEASAGDAADDPAIWVDQEERARGSRLVGIVFGALGVAVLLGVDLGGEGDQLLGGLAV
ncbi:phytase, partial [uncultured Jatrophihabitans sp.]|uniref:phytase n=1 Tax=uncultured Jatrophihabitans sp. TaxID=1610747 RepID=UPI0035C96C33